MTLELPIFQQNNEYPANETRALLQALITQGVVGMGTALEVVPRGAGANMTVDVGAGICVIAGDDAADQGVYVCRSTDTENVGPIGAAPAAGQARIDLIVARVRDAAVIGGSDNDWVIEVVAGVAGVSPSAPATPDSAIVLARIAVADDTVAIDADAITDYRSPCIPTNGPYSPAGSKSGVTDRNRLTSGDISFNHTTWTAIDTDLDIVMPARVGDWIEAGVGLAAGAEAVTLLLEIACTLAGILYRGTFGGSNYSAAHDGIPGLRAEPTGAAFGVRGSCLYQVTALDLLDGETTLRLMGRCSAAVAKTIAANSNNALEFWARNLG